LRRTDYDALAHQYSRRYQQEDWGSIKAALVAFIGTPNPFVLEVGCGTGHWLGTLADGLTSLTGVDLSWNMLAEARTELPTVPLVQATAETLPFPDRTFDRLFCINALHHFPDKQASIAEARRVLRPNGRFMTIALDPHTSTDQWWVYDYFDRTLALDRERYPACAQIIEWMSAEGFTDGRSWEVQHFPGRIPARDALSLGMLDRAYTSQLAILTSEEYERGVKRVRTDLEAKESRGETLFLESDLRVYATSGVIKQ
jgi:ubiquinone/menaquinone biosynthesis C-methylase UbiE